MPYTVVRFTIACAHDSYRVDTERKKEKEFVHMQNICHVILIFAFNGKLQYLYLENISVKCSNIPQKCLQCYLAWE
jgi:hypothetical protein